MGLTAGVSSSAAGVSSSAISLTSPVGVGVGGVVVAAALILLLAYYDVINASAADYSKVKETVPAAIGPLLLTFGGIFVFESLVVLGYLG
jgi:hypothetical protein